MITSAPAQQTVTEVLCTADTPAALDRVLPLVYDELRVMAHRRLARERPGHTLSTTALVHEAYLKLVDETRVTEKGRAYFFGAAARAMRQVLVDYARRRNRHKRGGNPEAVTLHEVHLTVDAFATHLLDLDAALSRLAALDGRAAHVVECHIFGGLNMTETARVVGVSARTARRDWAMAKAWLYREMSADE